VTGVQTCALPILLKFTSSKVAFLNFSIRGRVGPQGGEWKDGRRESGREGRGGALVTRALIIFRSL